MRFSRALSALLVFSFAVLLCGLPAMADPAGSAGTITGTVTDSTGAVIPGAAIAIHSALSGYRRSTTTGADGTFTFTNVPFANYHLTVTEAGFQPIADDVPVQSAVAVNRTYVLKVALASTTVTVEADSNDIINKNPGNSTDIDTSLTSKLPLLASSTGISSAITLAAPGVAADSNGMFHPLGEHSDTTYSIDGQPISDQQSKTFSNQLSMDAIQSIKVIEGTIPAEYGDKASLVARTTTKSGLGNLKPTGSAAISYGSFGTTNLNASVGLGTARWGDFLALNGANSGRFLDTPESTILHAHGNDEGFFNRADFAPNANNTFHLNLTGSRSWFQVPNQFDQQAQGQDQRSEIFSYNIAPFWTHIVGQTGVLSVNPYFRNDNVHYYPSHDIFDDTPATLSQDRSLRNVGLKVDYSYAKGINSAKFGVDVNHTFLHENFAVGITSPTYNAVCVDSNGSPVAASGVRSPSQCAASGYSPNPSFQPGLLAFDLTRGGSLFHFHGHTDIKEEALYGEDNITLKQWQFMIGLRGDNYNGLSRKYMLEPRAGVTYQVKKTGTVLRLGYSRLMPTPYNEGLLLSSSTGSGGLAQNIGGSVHPLKPATRNQYDAGFEQGFGKYLVVDGQYFWKETKGDYDFDVLLNTPLTFPIQWRKSKIDGFDIRLTMPETHGVSAYSVMGHARARFFGPETGGILFNNPNIVNSYAPFRIDHDQNFQQTTHLQFQPKPQFGYFGFTWTYESGMVAGNAPFATSANQPSVNLTYLTPDEQQQIKLTCAGRQATLDNPLISCAPNQLSSPLLTLPAPGTENPDRNPPRIAPRNIFDMSAGWDNLFSRKRFKTDASFSVTNVTNKLALYNFLSTFSGTHFVPPRGYVGQLTLNF